MLRLRRCNAMLIGGGEPLTHPRLDQIVSLVKSHRVKPVLITNGVGLDQAKVRKLKKAGLYGFTFHIDAHQSRPGWQGKNEAELNELRQHYAEMLHTEGGLCCSFNVTLFPDTLKDVAVIVAWAVRNIDKVHVLTLIPVRMMHENDPYDYFVRNKKIVITDTPYASPHQYRHISAAEVYQEIIKMLPGYKFNAFLGGTACPDSLKWLAGNHLGAAGKFYGNAGPKTMELLQNIHHWFTGSYLAFAPPRMNRQGKLMLVFGLFDRELRKTAGRFFSSLWRDPAALFRRLHVQSISVVQPVDILDTGEMDYCDGCPNMTYWNERLVPACRLEEYLIYGAPITSVPRDSTAAPERAAA